MNDLDYVLERIDPWIDRYISAGPCALGPLEKVGVGVWMLEAEVNNGGFDQYYFNSAGDLALQTVDALNAIGASNTASLLSAANAEFPRSVPTVNRTERQETLDQIRDTVRFASLEEKFYRDEEDLIARLASYLRSHR